MFLLKDSKRDTDLVENLDEVFDVGVYARIGGFFETEHGEATVILYPTHRIKLGDLDYNPVTETQTETETEVEAPVENDVELEADSNQPGDTT